MKRKILLSFLLMVVCVPIAMATGQEADVMVYKGEARALFSNPLESFYERKANKRPNFWVKPNTTSSGNWRGYVASWEIIDNRLYLTKIDSWFCGPGIKGKDGCRPVKLADLFGAKVVQGKVLASWFSGELRVPDGKELQYVHMGYGSVYERDMIFEVKAGAITKKETIDNTKNQLPSEQELALRELETLKAKEDAAKRDNAAAPPAIKKPNEKSEPVLLTELGWGKVVVGAKRKVVEEVLGKGEPDSKYDDVYFVEYPQQGVQISYTNKADEAHAIFFYNKQNRYADFAVAQLKTDKGVTWDSSPEDIIKAYGKPPRDFSDESGRNAWRRLEYDKIDFLFQQGRLTRIGLSEKNCTGCEK